MNSTMFKNNPTKTEEELEYAQKPMYSFGFQIEKCRDNPLYRILRRVGGICGVMMVPTLLGIVLGMWMDTLWPSDHAWLSISLPLGALLGCLTAALWLSQDKGDKGAA